MKMVLVGSIVYALRICCSQTLAAVPGRDCEPMEQADMGRLPCAPPPPPCPEAEEEALLVRCALPRCALCSRAAAISDCSSCESCERVERGSSYAPLLP